MVGEDLRARKAIELVADEAKPIELEEAEAREKMWTPEKEREDKEGKSEGLWTPDSD